MTEQRVPASAIRLAGLTPFTTIDYPGKLSAVAFVQGCPWQCVYCQNRWMQPRTFDPSLEHSSWEALADLLSRRRGLLDAVVFSGGEPCLDPALPAAIETVREMGFLVGLHTGGSYPRRLREMIGRLDWVGLDVKAEPGDEAHWRRIVGVDGACARWSESLDVLLESGIAFECRTTAHPDYFDEAALLRTARYLSERGVSTYALQICRRPPGQLFSCFGPVPADWPTEATIAELESRFVTFTLRRD